MNGSQPSLFLLASLVVEFIAGTVDRGYVTLLSSVLLFWLLCRYFLVAALAVVGRAGVLLMCRRPLLVVVMIGGSVYWFGGRYPPPSHQVMLLLIAAPVGVTMGECCWCVVNLRGLVFCLPLPRAWSIRSQELWGWLEPYMDDEEEFKPSPTEGSMTMGKWVRKIIR